ncbi:DUF4982 domain-containing protein [Puteibacter caeruleilacunae]|nr:DUF4982 domain-containing protein [Puteibacter caeruleilacunae]
MMRHFYARLEVILLFVLIGQVAWGQRQVVDLSGDWLFTHQDNEAFANGLVSSSGWQKVTVPHDWAFINGVSRDGAQQDRGGYRDGGIGWYSKTFKVDKNWKDKRTVLEFDGVYMNSEVWLNGHYLGKRVYGYISFRYDISEYLVDGENRIAVRVDNTLEPSARWYHPCGIYAPVKLIVTEKDYIVPNGVYITTPSIEKNRAEVKIETTLRCVQDDLVLETTIHDANGKVVDVREQEISADIAKGNAAKNGAEVQKIVTKLMVANPQLWDVDAPYLYRLSSCIKMGSKTIDEVNTLFGVRTIEWSTENGFLLNGRITKLQGVCEHWEGGPVGGAWTKPLLRWKISLLKEMGVNAIRTAHNPNPPFFYDLCDEMGIMVMDEIFDGWKKKATHDYGQQAFADCWEEDLTEWIKRDRNHPSIIIYSVGNETGGSVAIDLVAKCHELDDTRLVTSGHSGSEAMDVFGVNGHSEMMHFFEKERPNKPFVATEAPHTWQTRGYYRTKTWFRDGYPNKRQSPFPLPDLTEKEVFSYEWAPESEWSNKKQHFNSSYDNAMVRISARKCWELARDLPWYSGQFRWTGFDYYGEAGYVHGGWPFRLFMGGTIDVAGFKKDLFYFYQSQWTKEPMVHILPHWTHHDVEPGTVIPVWVYSNCDEVELLINGKSLGKDKPGMKWDEMQCEFMVPYEAGTIVAKGYKNGKVVTETQHVTVGTPAAFTLSLDDEYLNPERDNYAIVTATITDTKGNFYPYGDQKLFYHLEGDARFISLENGDPVDTTLNVGINNKKAFMGLTNAFVALGEGKQKTQLTVGAIIRGDGKASIDVHRLAIKGKADKAKWRIYYTTDGSEPTVQCAEYKAPFVTRSEGKIRAVVIDKGEKILELEE